MFTKFGAKVKNFVRKSVTWFDGEGIDRVHAPEVVTIDPITAQLIFSSNYRLLSQKGYIENVIANTCMRRIGDAVKNIPFEVFIDNENIKDRSDRQSRALAKSILNPNPDFNWQFMIESLIKYRYIDGRSYLYPIFAESTGEILGFDFFRPDRVTVTQSDSERIYSYRYVRGSQNQVFKRDEEGYFDIIDWRQFNPMSDTSGLSSIVPASLSIDGHTKGNSWNKQILENSGKQTMIMSLTDEENSMELDEDQLNKLKESIKQQLNERRGGVALINAPVKIDKASMTAVEMDWLDGIKSKAIEICNALDFPPYLLGLDGATYNNQAEAKMAFYEDCAIPKTEEFFHILNAFLSRKTDSVVQFKVQKKEITALAPKYELIRTSIREDWKVSLINRDEAREKIGYDEIGGLDGDVYFSDLKNPIKLTTSDPT